MPGRELNSSSYRYSINGQEKTSEIAPNTTTAEFWQYDARIVRRWNIDPVVREYESPYLCFNGRPITNADPLGNEPNDWIKKKNKDGTYSYTWRKDVTGKENTPAGYEYVGAMRTYYSGDAEVTLWKGGAYSYAGYPSGTSPNTDPPSEFRSPSNANSSTTYTYRQATVSAATPQVFNNDFERGMVENNVATQAAAGLVAPTLMFARGAVQVGAGVHSGDKGLLISGGLDMLSGGSGIKWGNGLKGLIPKTGTVFDDITPTQPYYPGSQLPKSFSMDLTESSKIWVHGNATEHIAEYLNKTTLLYTPQAKQLAMQTQLASLQAAAREVTKNGIKYNQMMTVGGWELKFGQAAQSGQLPTLFHARPIQ